MNSEVWPGSRKAQENTKHGVRSRGRKPSGKADLSAEMAWAKTGVTGGSKKHTSGQEGRPSEEGVSRGTTLECPRAFPTYLVFLGNATDAI